MNLDMFFLEIQDFQTEIGQMIDDKEEDLNRLWNESDRLLDILEKIINFGKHGETK